MAMVATKKSAAPVGEGEESRKIRIKLSSRDVGKLESVCDKLKKKATERGHTVAGPVRLPTKHLQITTRKAPSGEGTNTWDNYRMRIHSRIVELHAPLKEVKSLTQVDIEAGVIVDVKVILRKRRRFVRKAF
jgi:small subunit ribosomal protein S20e